MTDTDLIIQALNDLRREMRDMRADFNSFSQDCGARLSTVETSVHSLVGNGQPGRVGLLEAAHYALSKKVSWMWGWAAGAGAAVGLFAGGIMVEVFKR
jgi:hypothetical protein